MNIIKNLYAFGVIVVFIFGYFVEHGPLWSCLWQSIAWPLLVGFHMIFGWGGGGCVGTFGQEVLCR